MLLKQVILFLRVVLLLLIFFFLLLFFFLSILIELLVPADDDDDLRNHPLHAARIIAAAEGIAAAMEEGDPDAEEVEDVFDQATDLPADGNDNIALQRHAQYQQEKRQLFGETVNCSPSKSRESINWKCIPGISKTPCNSPPKEFAKIGIKYFDFNKLEVKRRGHPKRINLLKLLIHLWPGNWKAQVARLNLRIRADNRAKQQSSRTYAQKRLMRDITHHEFWVFWGVTLTARTKGRMGGKLWDKVDPEGYDDKIDMSIHMTESRVKDIKKYIPYLFADATMKEEDPWWQLSNAIKLFNQNRRDKILPSYLKVFDETMSAFRPRTTARGNLPHLSCIKRKPKPLGTEYKVTADTATEIFLHLEIQRGKIAMKDPKFAEYGDVFGGTVACSKRMSKNTTRTINDIDDNGVKNLWLGDSWFASVKTTIQLAPYGNFIGIVKTAHSFFPKKWLENKMKNWPAGSSLVLEGRKDGVDMLAIGYKYCKRKVISFIATKGSGHTEPGIPYEARWKDENGATMYKEVERPDIISRYFTNSNVIDVGNQSRQHDLRLEQHWITADGFFRNITTLFGINVVDSWKGYRYHLDRSHRHKNIDLIGYTKILIWDMFNNDFNTKPEAELAHSILTTPTIVSPSMEDRRSQAMEALLSFATIEAGQLENVSALTEPTNPTPENNDAGGISFGKKHELVFSEDFYTTNYNEKDGSQRQVKRKKRGKCVHCRRSCSRYCKTCFTSTYTKYWCCANEKYGCQQKHLHITRKKNR